jgi:hypothetical protein
MRPDVPNADIGAHDDQVFNPDPPLPPSDEPSP